jgi:predicted transcriptional regulator
MKISAVLPDPLHARLEKLARENDRSMSAELRRAVAAYVATTAGSSTARGEGSG